MSPVIRLRLGDCRLRMTELPSNSVDAVIFDPPYELGFMGKDWDSTGIAFDPTMWGEVYRVLKPGGKVKAFSATRTYHRVSKAMEAAGFPRPECNAWGYGSGMPLGNLDVPKGIDKLLGAEREVKRVPFSGNALHRSGGQNTRPWMEEALKRGYHEVQGDEPASEEAKLWDGYGSVTKPAWEPILVGMKPGRVA